MKANYRQSIDPRDTFSLISLDKISELEQTNENYKKLILEKENLINQLKIKNENKLSNQNDIKIIENDENIDKIKSSNEKILNSIENINLEINNLEKKKNESKINKSDIIQLRQTANNLENQLKDQRKQRDILIDKLLYLKNQLGNLEGLEWEKQKIIIQKEIKNFEEKIQNNNKEILIINNNIENLLTKKSLILSIYRKWKDHLNSIIPVENSIEELLNQISNKKLENNSNFSKLQLTLNKILENNYLLNQQILKEKKSNQK